MFDIFLTAVNAIVPIVLLILIGYFLKRIKFLTDDFLKAGNKLVFNVCLPCMLFVNIYSLDFSTVNWGLVIYSVAAIIIIFFISLAVSVLTTKDNRRRGVILQCCYRSNFAIIGTSLAAALAADIAGAEEAVNGAVALLQLFTIPMFNILAVISLSVFVDKPQAQLNSDGMLMPPEESVDLFKKHAGFKNILLNIVKNPLIIGIFTGLVFVGIRYIEIAACGEVVFSFREDLTFLYIVCDDLKAVATPLALIVLGGNFVFSAVKGMTKEIIVATMFRVVMAPLIGIGCAVLLSEYTDLVSFGVTEYPVLVCLFGTPVAVSSAIMAGEMGNDEQLAGQLVTWTSVCSVLTLFLTVFILMSAGLMQ